MLELLSRRWQLVVLRGVLAILFGVLALVWPQITVLALAILWGAYALVDGIAGIGMAFGRGSGADRVLLVLLGLLGIAAGVVTFLWPAITVVVLLLVIAIWAIIAGITQIVAAIRLRRTIRNEWLLALSGLLTLALGVLLVVQPAEGAIALVIAIAVFAIVWGVVLVMFGFRLRAHYARDDTTTHYATSG